MENAKSFVKEVLARFKGDTDEVVAQRNYRKATAAVEGQLSSLASKKVDAEEALEEAKDELKSVKYPTEPIKDTSKYVRDIVTYQTAVDTAEEELKNVNDSIEFFKNLKKEFNS